METTMSDDSLEQKLAALKANPAGHAHWAVGVM
jgi:hypothetical protein